MKNYYISTLTVGSDGGPYVACSELPHYGVIYRVDGEISIEGVYGLKPLSLNSDDHRLVCIVSEGQIVYGSVEIDVLTNNEYPEITFYTKDSARICNRSWKRTVSRFYEGERCFDYEGKFSPVGYNDGIFYGYDLDSRTVSGVGEEGVVWQVPYDSDYRTPHPFLLQNNFYLYSGEFLASYSYNGGTLNFKFQLDSVPVAVYEVNKVAALQNETDIIILNEQGHVLGRKFLPQGGQFELVGCYLLGMDDQYVYVTERVEQSQTVVIYNYLMEEQHRIQVPPKLNLTFQNVSSELNTLCLTMDRESIIGSSMMSFWHPNETLSIQSFIPLEKPFNVERVIEHNIASYEVSIEADNKHDFFRICDVIVLDVANKYGEDYCERPDVDRQFGGDIRVLVSPKLFNEEPEWMITVQERLNNLIKEYGGNMHSGVVSGDKKKHIEVVLVPANT